MKHLFQTALIFPFVLFFSCTKEHSNRWMLADVTILDYHTETPIMADVTFNYTDESGTAQSEGIGALDGSGNIKLERKVAHYTEPFSLMFYGSGKYADGYPGDGTPDYILDLEHKSANEHMIYLKENRKFKLHVENMNCFDATDSVWINLNGIGTYCYTGCQDDTYFNPTYGFFGRWRETEIYATITAKKNGITTVTNETFPLQANSVTTVSVEY